MSIPGEATSSRLGFLLALALLAAIALACSGANDAPAPLDVPASWALIRELPGHAKHLQQEGISCGDCHDLAATRFENPGPTPCARCHQGRASMRHAVPEHSDALSDCTACHNFARSQAEPNAPDPPWDCIRCHQNPQHDVPAIEVHTSALCETCHSPHQQMVQATGCGSCHENVHSTHQGVGLTEEQACSSCHKHHHARGHDAVGSCDGCHGPAAHRGLSDDPQIAGAPQVSSALLFSPGHTACTDCHQAHDFAKPAECTSCHQDRHTLAEQRVPAHASCTSCHPAHNAKFDANRSCAECHKGQQNDHPGGHPGMPAGTCTSCHQPHPPSATASTAIACSSCHSQAHDDRSFHAKGVACTTCHTPHQFKLGRDVLGVGGHGAGAPCASCHSAQLHQVTAAKGHADCTACHEGLPHQPSATKPCTGCHADQAHDKHGGQAACTSCHQPHDGKALKSCGSCHAVERSSAPGGHQQCLSCHQPHGEGMTAVPACQSCHQNQAQSPHGTLQGGCGNCHRAHGPDGPSSPPACTSCHQKSTLPALHQVASHGQCGNCHQAHATKPSDEPALCRSCHQAQSNHFPETNRCSGCHQFKPF